MSTQLKELVLQDSIQKRLNEMLGRKAQGFISSMIQVVNDNKLLAKADPKTVLNAAITAATLDLPINKSLGQAYIVPYRGQAQFQIGWKGLVQLALRTGQYRKINVIRVYDNQFKSFDTLTEDLQGDFTLEGEGDPIGYAAFFQLVNGFQKTVYWNLGKVVKHAKRYSKTYGHQNSSWTSNFDEMGMKTVLKNTLDKWGIKSIEMQTAILADQGVQEDDKIKYPDNPNGIDLDDIEFSKQQARLKKAIDGAKDLATLDELAQYVTTYGLDEEFENKHLSLSTEKKK